jgi:glycosyltransferase involved in cell wall biosynthesis
MKKDISLIIINQTITQPFYDWVINFAEIYGPVMLWTGNPPEVSNEQILIRTLPAYNRSTSISRLVTWIYSSLVVALQLLFVAQDIPVYAVSNPPFLPLILGLLHKIRPRRYALLEYDIYPQIIVAMGLIRETNIIYRFWHNWHVWSMEQACLIITIAEGMADTLQGMPLQHLPKLYVVPTWANTRWLQPLHRANNPFARELDLDTQFVVLYSGNLGATHAIETIIEVAEVLHDYPSIQFIIIGDGSKRKLIETALDTRDLPNLRLLPLQPYENLPYSLSLADVSIVTLAKGYEMLSMPSKTYDLMAVGSAILGISFLPSTLANVIKTHACGANFRPDQVREIADWLIEISKEPNHLKNLQSAARRAAQNHFSEAVVQADMNQLLATHLLLADKPTTTL